MARLITEEIIDKAIDAAELGHVNGLTYDQSSWCGTACCVLGFARHIAGLPEKNNGPQDEEFVDSPRIMAIRQLMRSPTPAILGIMRKVSAEGKIDLRGVDLTGAVLADADLTGCDLTGAVLTHADLTGCDLTDADLTDADLAGCDLTDAVLRGAYLRGAVLTGAVLTHADLTGAVLTHANLTRANLTRANLTDAVFTGCDLTDAYLRGAVLRGADLTDVILTRAVRWETETDSYVAVTSAWLIEKGAML